MDLKYRHLEGLHFEHGVQDCYEIQRMFWRDNFGVELPNYARPDKWWDHGSDLYMEHFSECGFKSIDVLPHEYQPADVFLIAVQAPVANHSAIYLGGELILHHFIGRFSNVERYKGFWRNRTLAVLRHQSLMDWKPSESAHDLLSEASALVKRKVDEVSR